MGLGCICLGTSAVTNRIQQQVVGARVPALALALAISAVSSSCGKSVPEIKGKLPVFPVKGSVQLDGQPLSRAEIVFHPFGSGFPDGAAKNLPQARTDGDGNFTISTYVDGDGAPVGDYRVTIKWRGDEGRTDDEGNLLPAKYANSRATQLRAKIEEGENQLPPFELKMPPQQASN
jgi:hypothetical protein